MTGLGVLWAAFAPLSLVLAAVALAFVLRRLWPQGGRRWPATALAVAIVAAPVAWLWGRDHAAFAALCRAEGAATIVEKARADGFLLTSGTSNSFGMRYLQSEGFAWIESNDIYRRGGFVRYTRNDKGEIVTEKIDAPAARYEVRETFDETGPTVGVSRTRVIDRTTGNEMAHAASLNFSGGRATWALGAWGMASCPSASSDPAAFNAWYHLARDTLR